MKEYKGTIAKCWEPTFENVTREFITETLYKIMFSERLPNFKFDFREKEAIDFIEEVLGGHIQKYDFYEEETEKIIETLRNISDINTDEPIMIIKDYRRFFQNLRQLYEKNIELFFSRTRMPVFNRGEKNNFFEQIWLRATPEDFNNPEEFLEKQIQMVSDTTFEKYNEETYLGHLDFLNNSILYVKNGIARTWDENFKEIELTIYAGDSSDYKKEFSGMHYTLPVIRYGIYEKNGKKICSVGSIQNKSEEHKKSDMEKKFERKKYRANEGIPEEDTYKVEPKNLIALSIFVNMLNEAGITEFEIPSLYVLDYDYHIKRSKQLLLDFEKDWTEEKIKKFPDVYKEQRYYFERLYNKEDIISEIKTERLMLTFRRLLQHYTSGRILSYPGDVDNFMHLSIPKIKSENEINGSFLKKLYKLQENDIER